MSEHLRSVILLLLVVVFIVLVSVLDSLLLTSVDKFYVVVVGVEGVDLVEIILLILAVAPLLLPIAVGVLCPRECKMSLPYPPNFYA